MYIISRNRSQCFPISEFRTSVMLLVQNTNKYYVVVVPFHVILLRANCFEYLSGGKLYCNENNGTIVFRNQTFYFLKQKQTKPSAATLPTNSRILHYTDQSVNEFIYVMQNRPLVSGSIESSLIWDEYKFLYFYDMRHVLVLYFKNVQNTPSVTRTLRLGYPGLNLNQVHHGENKCNAIYIDISVPALSVFYIIRKQGIFCIPKTCCIISIYSPIAVLSIIYLHPIE